MTRLEMLVHITAGLASSHGTQYNSKLLADIANNLLKELEKIEPEEINVPKMDVDTLNNPPHCTCSFCKNFGLAYDQIRGT